MGAVIRSPGEAIEELHVPYHRCAGRSDGVLVFAQIINLELCPGGSM